MLVLWCMVCCIVDAIDEFVLFVGWFISWFGCVLAISALLCKRPSQLRYKVLVVVEWRGRGDVGVGVGVGVLVC